MASPVFIVKRYSGAYYTHDSGKLRALINGVKEKIAREGYSQETKEWIAEVNKRYESQKEIHKPWRERVRVFNHQFFNDSEPAVDGLRNKENCNKPPQDPATLPSTVS